MATPKVSERRIEKNQEKENCKRHRTCTMHIQHCIRREENQKKNKAIQQMKCDAIERSQNVKPNREENKWEWENDKMNENLFVVFNRSWVQCEGVKLSFVIIVESMISAIWMALVYTETHTHTWCTHTKYRDWMFDARVTTNKKHVLQISIRRRMQWVMAKAILHSLHCNANRIRENDE